jgi:arylsulfatase A-like enzyme
VAVALTVVGERPGAALVASAAGAGPAARPHIVVLMADDLDLLSFQAATLAGYLPHLTRLFAAGTRFNESFVSESLCCPSRATFLTGLNARNHGVLRNRAPRGGFSTFMEGFAENHLGTWMQSAGYRTAYVGKYLNGYVDGRRVPPGWDDWHVLVDPTTYCMYGYLLSRNGDPVYFGRGSEGNYQTDVLAGAAEEVIGAWHGEQDTRPLFLSVSTAAPHKEWGCYEGIRPAPRHERTPRLGLARPPSFDEADMGDKPAWMRALPPVDEAALEKLYHERIASLRALDDLVGRVSEALEAAGALDTTAFLFTSDNGYMLGRHRLEGKAVFYEESIRVPLLLRVPGLDGPRAVDALALNNDLAPTLAEVAGTVPAMNVDGRSLLPLLRGTVPTWRKRFLIALPPAGPFSDPLPEVPPFFAVRTGDDGEVGRLAYAETTTEFGTPVTARELYDLRADRFQVESRHRDAAYADRQRRLRQYLEALKDCGDGSCQALEE